MLGKTVGEGAEELVEGAAKQGDEIAEGVAKNADEIASDAGIVAGPSSVSPGLTVEPVERIGVGRVGQDFIRNAEDGLPRFEARLLDGEKTLNIGWTDNIPRTAVRLREVQQLAGGPGSFIRITGLASAEFEAAIRSGAFDVGKAADMLGKAAQVGSGLSISYRTWPRRCF